MKKPLCLLIALLIILSMQQVSIASSDNSPTIIIGQGNQSDTEHEHMVIDGNEVCNGKTYHDMVSRGWGTVYIDGVRQLFMCPCWQCSGCYLVMVTQGEVLQGYPAGYYAIELYYEPISIYGCVMYTDRLYYSELSNIPGYHFRY